MRVRTPDRERVRDCERLDLKMGCCLRRRITSLSLKSRAPRGSANPSASFPVVSSDRIKQDVGQRELKKSMNMDRNGVSTLCCGCIWANAEGCFSLPRVRPCPAVLETAQWADSDTRMLLMRCHPAVVDNVFLPATLKPGW